MTPAWILDLLAAVMLAVAAVSAARLVAAQPWRPGGAVYDTDVAHLLMSIAMAGMFTSSLTTLPDTAWEVVFGLMTAWFLVRVVLDTQVSGVRALAGGHCAPHLVHSAAMLYMFLAMSAPAAGSGGMGGMAGMAAGSGSMTLRHPTLAFIFALILAGYTIWDLDQLSGRRYSRATAQVSLAGAVAPAGPGPAVADSAFAALPGSRAAVAGPGDDRAVAPGRGARTSAAAGTSGAAETRGQAAGRFLLSPAVTVGCRITMGVAMAFLLIIAI
jgi:Domain of unknown function (DUF5134)